MSAKDQKIPTNPAMPPAASDRTHAGFPRGIALTFLALIAAFSFSLFSLFRFALSSDLYSYILLIPAVSGYLFHIGPSRLPLAAGVQRAAGISLLALGLGVVGFLWAATASNGPLPQQDSLAFSTLSFVIIFAGTCALLLPPAVFRRAIFPLIFLLFLAPFPLKVEHGIEMLLQHGSAPPAYWFLKLAGTPVFRQDLVFQLPGMTLQIAPECSGIRSTLVLFMTSLVAGHLFLRSGWKRTILTAAVIPLALVRNGFRVFVIGELCVRVGPHMIDSAIHHQGGPIFFALSLIPFSILVYFLVRSDRATRVTSSSPAPR